MSIKTVTESTMQQRTDIPDIPEVERKLPEWYVYIIRASDDSLYTGVTIDVERRFAEHGHPDKRARYFRGRKPLQVVYTEQFENRSRAQRREAEIKKLSRKGKLKLVHEYGIKPPGRPC